MPPSSRTLRCSFSSSPTSASATTLNFGGLSPYFSSVASSGFSSSVVLKRAVCSWLVTPSATSLSARALTGETTGQLTLGLAITRDTKANPKKTNDEARLVVFGDSEMLAREFGYDRNLVMNSIAWASQQVQRITIRPPDRDISTIDINPERFSNIRLVAMDLLPMLLMGVGLTIWLTRRAR